MSARRALRPDVLRPLAGLAIVASAATLVVSLTLPTVTFHRVLSPVETYSIFGGIESLWKDGNTVLATIVFLFSMVFPVAKLLALGAIWLRRGSPAARVRTIHWLQLLGKWSMLDVFIVAAFVGSIQLGIAVGTSRPGIYVFALAILMSMGSTLLVARMEGVRREVAASGALRAWWARLLSTASAACLGAGLPMAIFHVSKGFVFANEVRLPRTAWRMAVDAEVLLAVLLGIFVIGASVARALVLLRLRWLGGARPATVRVALGLDEWTMLDVFGLGLVIVWVKLDELATTTLGVGFWLLLAAGVLCQVDGWALRRTSR